MQGESVRMTSAERDEVIARLTNWAFQPVASPT